LDHSKKKRRKGKRRSKSKTQEGRGLPTPMTPMDVGTRDESGGEGIEFIVWEQGSEKIATID